VNSALLWWFGWQAREGAGEMLGATGVALAVGIGLAGLAMIVLLDVALAAVV